MFRINLLRDVSGNAEVAGVGTSGGFLSTLKDSPMDQFDLGVKVTLVIVPFIFMMGYRQFIISRAEADHTRLIKEQKDIDTQLRKYDSALKDIEKFDEQKQKFNSQLEVIKKLSRERLKTVKSLDALQKIVPNSAWLNSLKVKGDKVDVEGFAVNDVVVSEFIQSLSTSIFFSHVVLTDSVEATTPEGTVKKFKIKFDLEKI